MIQRLLRNSTFRYHTFTIEGNMGNKRAFHLFLIRQINLNKNTGKFEKTGRLFITWTTLTHSTRMILTMTLTQNLMWMHYKEKSRYQKM